MGKEQLYAGNEEGFSERAKRVLKKIFGYAIVIGAIGIAIEALL